MPSPQSRLRTFMKPSCLGYLAGTQSLAITPLAITTILHHVLEIILRERQSSFLFHDSNRFIHTASALCQITMDPKNKAKQTRARKQLNTRNLGGTFQFPNNPLFLFSTSKDANGNRREKFFYHSHISQTSQVR